KVSRALLCFFTTASCLETVPCTPVHVSSSNCCFNFSEKRIAPQRIRCYKHTSSTCSRRGLIFARKLCGQLCSNKKQKWSQNYRRHWRQNIKTPNS
uniref:C-C motif chemokine n=1 Tax=Canis lupus familiaris TaxID=9615 RepID=A0A8C0NNV6_CANLF